MIEDSNFLADTKRALKILDGLIDYGSPFDIYITGARVDAASRDLYQTMRKAGVTFISYGLESGSQDTLDYYHKNITLNQIETGVRLAKEAGLITWGNFILGAPNETKEQINKTIALASHLPLDIAFFRTLLYQYGSDLWHEAVHTGVIQQQNGDVVTADARRNLGLLTEEELSDYCQKALIHFYLNPAYLSRQLFRAIKTKDKIMPKLLYAFLRTPGLVSGSTL